MNFFLTIKNSIYNPDFYRSIPKKTFWGALGYYLLLCLCITLFTVAFLAFPIVKNVNAFIQTASQKVVTAFPKDLTIQVHNGVASINQKQPYIIPICDDNHTSCDNIILDTRNEQPTNYFSKDTTLFVVTKNAAFFKDDNGQIRGYTLDKLGDFTLNRGTLMSLIHEASPWFPFISPLILVGATVLLYLGYLFKLLYFLLLALIFWLIARRFVPGTKYASAYKLVLYSVTLGMLVGLILDATDWFTHVYSFPFMGTILAILVFIVNFGTTPTTKMPLTKTPTKPTKKRKTK